MVEWNGVSIRIKRRRYTSKLVDKFCEMINELDMNSIDRLELE
ncbi:hypothetical protein [Clostridium homopropionicum]|nr:hypothetical protein [Clostridium homopropionicum]